MIYTSKPSITSQETEDKLPGVYELETQMEKQREGVIGNEKKD